MHQVALVITDGEQTKDDNSNLSVEEILARAAKPLKDKGVRVIALGIGSKVNMENLETIASDRRLVFKADSFYSLLRIVTNLKKGTCLGKKIKCVTFIAWEKTSAISVEVQVVIFDYLFSCGRQRNPIPILMEANRNRDARECLRLLTWVVRTRPEDEVAMSPARYFKLNEWLVE